MGLRIQPTKHVKCQYKMKKLLYSLLTVLIMTTTSVAWFDPVGPSYGKVAITRVNHFNTSTVETPWESEDTSGSYASTSFFDYNVDPPDNETFTPDHIAGPITPTPFYVSYPINFHVWIQSGSSSPYARATLEYATGTSADAADWNLIMDITEFAPVEGVEGAHFGIVTWTPPVYSDTSYLIRIWAVLNNGMESSDKTEDGLSKNGGGTWQDYEIALLKVANLKKPGVFGAASVQFVSYDRPPIAEDFESSRNFPVEKIKELPWWEIYWDKIKSYLKTDIYMYYTNESDKTEDGVDKNGDGSW